MDVGQLDRVEQVKTVYKHYTNQYQGGIVNTLNRVWVERLSCSPDMMDRIAKAAGFISLLVPSEKHAGYFNIDTDIHTADGYHWFAGVQYKSPQGNIVVLFPWCNTPEKPMGMNRSINVYSDKPLPIEFVETQLDNLAYQLVLGTDNKNTNLFRTIRAQVVMKRSPERIPLEIKIGTNEEAYRHIWKGLE